MGLADHREKAGPHAFEDRERRAYLYILPVYVMCLLNTYISVTDRQVNFMLRFSTTRIYSRASPSRFVLCFVESTQICSVKSSRALCASKDRSVFVPNPKKRTKKRKM